MTVRQAIHAARVKLATLDEASILVSILLSHSMNCSKESLWAKPDAIVPQEALAQFDSLIDRAARGEPLAYLLGSREFFGRSFFVTQNTLIPRPETECLVDKLITFFSSNDFAAPTIVDVGTGSGNIAITLALEVPRSMVYAIDISTKALEVAKLNAKQLNAPNVTFLQGSLLEPLQTVLPPGGVQAIAANLPYISDDEYMKLPNTVKDYEPALALRSGKDPDQLNSQLVKQAEHWLAPKSILVYETTNGKIVTPFN